jgi:hypothetical protein
MGQTSSSVPWCASGVKARNRMRVPILLLRWLDRERVSSVAYGSSCGVPEPVESCAASHGRQSSAQLPSPNVRNSPVAE